MPYTINKFNGEPLVVLDDGTIDTSTSIGLVGRNYVGYGETQNENFLYLLENFANDAPPSRPLKGQTWFDTLKNTLHVYSGSAWTPVGSATVAETAPDASGPGVLWLESSTNTLHVWNGDAWEFIGPEVAEGFGVTRARSTTLMDNSNVAHPVIMFVVDDEVIAITSQDAFTISPSSPILGFSNIVAGINISSSKTVKGSLTGNSDTATRLQTSRTINGVGFNGTQDIEITASTTRQLSIGQYLTGNNFNGSAATTWAVDASSANLAGKVVARNSVGGFSASTVTADLLGNVTASIGESSFNIVRANQFIGETLSGNAETATRLRTSRAINGVLFNGSENITVAAAAETLTGSSINPSVTESNLQRLGTLSRLTIADQGLTIGSASQFSINTLESVEIKSFEKLNLTVADTEQPGGFLTIQLMPAADSLSAGGENVSTVAKDTAGPVNLGHPANVWNKVYAVNFIGNADTATLATTATNLAGGGVGSIPYQTANGTTGMLPVGTAGYILKSKPGNTIAWEPLVQERLTKGSYLNYIVTGVGTEVTYFDNQQPVTISVDATDTNDADKIVARDSSGNFSANVITASLNGNASTATALETSRTINGVSFNGTANIVIEANDPNKLPLAGGTMTGAITLPGAPTAANHATTKAYVDTRIPNYTFRYGNTQYSTSGYTNQVGSWNNGANYFDVFPPAGKTMSDLEAFIPSIAVIHYAGGVNGDDSMRCTWEAQADRIRVWVQNTEQRSTPAANWLAIWR